MKKIVLLLTFGILCISCQPKIDKDPAPAPTEITSDTVVIADGHNARNSLQYLGAYKGFLKCDGCPEGQVLLELSEEFNYILTRSTNGKKQELKGSFSWNDAGNAVVLDNLKTNFNTFFVGENTLWLIDDDGNKSESALTKLTDAEAARTDAPSKLAAPKLADSKWIPTNFFGKPVRTPGEGNSYFLEFYEDGRFAASGGCNKMGGKYATTGTKVSFSQVMSTRMACPDMTVEQQMQQLFDQADSFSIAGQQLQLLSKEKIVATFAKK